MKRDTITLHGLRFQAHIGCTAEEQQEAQPLAVDVVLTFDTLAAARSGKLEETVDWAAVNAAIESVVQSRTWVLVEQLTNEIAAAILKLDRRIDPVAVTVKKFAFPHAEWVGISIERSRGRQTASSIVDR